MPRLILFSGGVESTAMLMHRAPDDVIVTIEDTSPGETATFNRQAVLQIATVLNIDVQFCTAYVPVARPAGVWAYQLWYFLPILALWLVKDPKITELWYGANKVELHTIHQSIKKFAQLKSAWLTMFPGVDIVYPLKSYTKEEQWDMIPAAVKPLVRTCTTNVLPTEDVNCGKCRKCLELAQLPGSCLHPV